MKVEFVNSSVVPAEEWTALVPVRVEDLSPSPSPVSSIVPEAPIMELVEVVGLGRSGFEAG